MNRRIAKRYNIFIETAIEAKGIRTEGVTFNVSLTGVCICCLSPFGGKTPVSLTLYFHDIKEGILKEVVQGVVQWEQKFGRLFMVGVKFPAPLNPEDHFIILSHIEQAKEFSEVSSDQ